MDAMEEKQFKTGAAVITQGDEGDNLYVIESGSLNCFKKFVRRTDDSFDRRRMRNLNF